MIFQHHRIQKHIIYILRLAFCKFANQFDYRNRNVFFFFFDLSDYFKRVVLFLSLSLPLTTRCLMGNNVRFTILIVLLCYFVGRNFICSDGNILGRHQLRICGQKKMKNLDFYLDDSSLLTMNNLDCHHVYVFFLLSISPSPISCYYLI
jgi:hypothetical protein